jgi:hemoglobin
MTAGLRTAARCFAQADILTHMSDTPYDLLGGDAAVRQLVDRFYDLMDTAPEAATIRALHATSLKVSREKLYKYFSGWMGGPPLYETEYGHPRLRMRHFPFPIGTRERDEWLWCMERAMLEQPMPDAVRSMLNEKLRALADHMRNQPEFGDGTIPLRRG